jgi:type II secretory ATPase GspE/PulE/Tfp pilus assembly ATPase PilB-like protein
VVRLLNPANVFLGLKQLGLRDADLKKIDDLVNRPYGMLLAAGPIGSGKTTTLYAALNKIDILTESIVTIEDPIEYELPGISQVQVDYKIHRTFANMLRSVLRQDVDTLLVGEIRDSETAMIATGAGMTGHLVFSTIHTNDAAGAITRLIQLAVPRFLVASSLIGICAQRLARRLCTNCRQEYTPQESFLEASGFKGIIPAGAKLYKPKGCSLCYHTGYHGRTGVFEVLEVSENIRNMVLEHAPESEIRIAAGKEGMTTLADDAVNKVIDGTTSLEEAAAVTGKGAL